MILKTLDDIGGTVVTFGRAMRHVGTSFRQIPRIFQYMYEMGYATAPMVVILSFFIGAVLALQTGYALLSFGDVKNSLGAVVGLSMTRELGPVMAAFLLIGRVGSAITAEIASMKVYQEIDALTVMRIPAERMLVLPRLIAVFFVMPILTILAIVVGWVGGMVISQTVAMIDVPSEIYWRFLQGTVMTKDVVAGLIKAQIFGVAIVLIACNTGLRTEGGPREVGKSVTRSVVVSMVFILIADYFVTKALT